MPLEIRDGYIFGPGVLDMKGGIAIGMLAVRALIEEEARRSRAVFVL